MENTFSFKLHDTELFGQYWKPQNEKAVIVLVHGMGEHMLRFQNSVIRHLLQSSYAVVALDLYGHGRSKGKRGHCPSYEALLDALDYTINKAKQLFPEKQVYLYGHSLGGNIVINYTLTKTHTINGVIATSPFLRLAFTPPKWKLTIGKLLFKILPSVTLSNELDVSAISRDPKEVLNYSEDSLIHNKISSMFSFPVFNAGEYALNNASKLQIPMLVLHGTGDRIIDYKAAEEFCNNTEKAKLVLFKDGYHELHHDLCKEEFIDTVLKWLDNM